MNKLLIYLGENKKIDINQIVGGILSISEV